MPFQGGFCSNTVKNTQENLTPKQIVERLDQYIIGQHEAKKAVAVALRNRYRRSQLSAELREEITPKNIIIKFIHINPIKSPLIMAITFIHSKHWTNTWIF